MWHVRLLVGKAGNKIQTKESWENGWADFPKGLFVFKGCGILINPFFQIQQKSRSLKKQKIY